MQTNAPRPAGADFRNGVPFLGGSLWIDLINSRFVLDGQRLDFLESATQFRHWLDQADVTIIQAEVDAERAAAMRLRDVLRKAYDRLRQGLPLDHETMNAINSHLGGQRTGYRLVRNDGNLVLEQIPANAGNQAAGTIALDFARFVVNFESARLKQCANPNCTMVFYDRGKNSRRRWCTMSICGNRDKVARFRARHTKI